MFKRVLISGDRHFGETEADVNAFNKAMYLWTEKHGMPEVIVEGCARGADSLAEQWAIAMKGAGEQDVVLEHWPAKWNEHDSYDNTCWCKNKSAPRCNGAGPIRNLAMLQYGAPDAVIAFHRDLAKSKGTRHMVESARKAGVPVWVAIQQPQRTLGL